MNASSGHAILLPTVQTRSGATTALAFQDMRVMDTDAKVYKLKISTFSFLEIEESLNPRY